MLSTVAVLIKKPAKGVQSKNTSNQETRIVAVKILNVRKHPSTHAAVVGKLTQGTVLPVTITGQWARLGNGQYVHAKFLEKPRSKGHKLALTR